MDLNLLYRQDPISEGAFEIRIIAPDKDNKVEDIQLWREFQSGNETAYAWIYRNNVSLLYRYGLKLINDKELIKDCIQDLFVEIWNTKHRLAPVKSIRPYLFKCIRRKLIAESVKKRRTVTGSTLSAYLKSNADHSVEFNLIEKQKFDRQRRQLKIALKNLTDRQREAIHLKYFAQLSYIEIAEVMALSKKGTYKLMGRSINLLRQRMADFGLGPASEID